MPLTSSISPYDETWQSMFSMEKSRVQEAFRAELIDIYHVGSTAVPGLSAKPEIDLLVEVSRHDGQTTVNEEMRSLGYERGKDLSPGHHFYRRDVGGMRPHKVHVCPTGHYQISRMLRFRDILGEDDRFDRPIRI